MYDRDRYNDGPRLIRLLPPYKQGYYLKRVGIGPVALGALIAIASHETSSGEPWVRVSDVSHILGVNVHPSTYRLKKLGWTETKQVPNPQTARGVPGMAIHIRVTQLGWEMLEFIGVKR